MLAKELPKPIPPEVVKWGWEAHTNPTVRDICAFAVQLIFRISTFLASRVSEGY